MEDEKTKWSVTYTKHVKQKRKVYQDGFLELHMSTNKVFLLITVTKNSGHSLIILLRYKLIPS